jgi:hypothetical protein
METGIDAEAEKLLNEVLNGVWEGLKPKPVQQKTQLNKPGRRSLFQSVKNHKLSR